MLRVQVIHDTDWVDVSLQNGEGAVWHGKYKFIQPLSAEDLLDLDWYWEKHRENALGAYSQRGVGILNRIPEFGAALWKSVFYENCPIGGMSSDDIISITLTSADPNFLALPWELMRDRVNEKPAALRGASIARSLQRPLLSVRHQGQPIKRILLVISRPSGIYAPSVGCVGGPLAINLARTPVDVTLLTEATPDQVRQIILKAKDDNAPYDLVHLDVHGSSGSATSLEDPRLLFESESGSYLGVVQQEVMSWLSAGSVRVLVQSSCRSIRPPTYIAQPPLTDVIGLSHELHPEAVSIFYETFYKAMASGCSVIQAVCRARISLAAARGAHSLSWPTVLHLRDPAVSLDDSPRLVNTTSGQSHTAAADPLDSSRLASEEAGRYPVEGRYLDGGLWAALGGALQKSGSVNIFGLRGYGRSTLLTACGAWLDTYLVTAPCIVLHGAEASGSDLISRMDSYVQACAERDVLSAERSRKHIGAILVDDIDETNLEIQGGLREYADSLSAANILLVCTSVARQDFPGMIHIEAPGDARSISQVLAGSVQADVISDLDSFLDGCPELFNRIESESDPACLLPDPWSQKEYPPNPTPQNLPRLARGMLSLNPTMGLVAGLLTRATPLVGLIQVLGFIENAAKEAPGEAVEPFDHFDAALKALDLTEDSMRTAISEAMPSRIVESSVLRQTGFLTTDNAQIMRVHPLIFSAAVAELSKEERRRGSLRLDWLARVYAAHLFKQTVRGRQFPQRLDLHVSCLLYCARRGLTVTASVLLGMLPKGVVNRSMVPSLGHQLRVNIITHTGHRPRPDQPERYLWMSSFALTAHEDGGDEAILEELALIDEEISAGESFDPDFWNKYRLRDLLSRLILASPLKQLHYMKTLLRTVKHSNKGTRLARIGYATPR